MSYFKPFFLKLNSHQKLRQMYIYKLSAHCEILTPSLNESPV